MSCAEASDCMWSPANYTCLACGNSSMCDRPAALCSSYNSSTDCYNLGYFDCTYDFYNNTYVAPDMTGVCC